MALYPLLDPFWSRFPWPDRIVVRTASMGPVNRVRLARSYFGRALMSVHCYAVGDTLVDTGFPAARAEVLALAADLGVRRVLLTHHHEDHAGNAAALVAAGLDVRAGALTRRLLAHDLPLPFYQHLAWGRTGPTDVAELEPGPVAIGPYQAEVLPAPGHSVDQLAFFVPAEGWLFAGDVFIHERVKIFRRDEDFAASVKTLERLVDLDFDVLFCGHRPLATGGRQALRSKLQHLREVEGGVRDLANRGLGVGTIVRRLRLERSAGFRWMSAGDASAANMVRSILHGPRPRAEVLAALGDGHSHQKVTKKSRAR